MTERLAESKPSELEQVHEELGFTKHILGTIALIDTIALVRSPHPLSFAISGGVYAAAAATYGAHRWTKRRLNAKHELTSSDE